MIWVSGCHANISPNFDPVDMLLYAKISIPSLNDRQ
uniref:Uncharacterized protein n=1 Tax=Anguilla anguilla TaxID=7936 RepID=A0A0E9SRU4_ANGAN